MLWHPAADTERAAISDGPERNAIQHAREKLEALGPELGAPHTSAIRGEDGSGLRELRPIYRRVQPRTLRNPRHRTRGPNRQTQDYDQEAANARQRFKELKPATPDHASDNKLAIIPVRRKGTA